MPSAASKACGSKRFARCCRWSSTRTGFFDTELLVLGEIAGLSIRELPITWIEDPDSRVNIRQTVWEDLQGLWRLRRTARPLVDRWRQGRGEGKGLGTGDY